MMSIRSRSGFWHDDAERQRAMLLLEVSRSYYELGMGQAEIAESIGYSRPTVGRLLQEARQSGIVQVLVTHPLERLTNLERMISGRYGVANVRIVPGGVGKSDGILVVATSLARFLERLIEPGMSLGFTSGRILQATVGSLRRQRDVSTDCVQMVGGTDELGSRVSTSDLIRRLAVKLDGVAHTFDAPILAATPKAAAQAISSPSVSRTLAVARNVDIAIVGIGAGFRQPADIFSRVLTPENVRALHRLGAVGHVLGQFIDQNGVIVDTALRDLVVAVPLDDVKRIPLVLGVAAGAQKAPAIAAALRGRFVNSLLLDVEAAQALAYLPERFRETPASLWDVPSEI